MGCNATTLPALLEAEWDGRGMEGQEKKQVHLLGRYCRNPRKTFGLKVSEMEMVRRAKSHRFQDSIIFPSKFFFSAQKIIL